MNEAHSEPPANGKLLHWLLLSDRSCMAPRAQALLTQAYAANSLSALLGADPDANPDVSPRWPPRVRPPRAALLLVADEEEGAEDALPPESFAGSKN